MYWCVDIQLYLLPQLWFLIMIVGLSFCVIPIARIAVVKPGGSPIICKTDEVGELVIQSPSTGSAYWGLSGKSSATFKVTNEECVQKCLNYFMVKN